MKYRWLEEVLTPFSNFYLSITSQHPVVFPKVLTTAKNNILTITSFPFHKETIVKLSCFPGIPLYLHFHFVPIKDRVRDFSPIEGVLMPIVERG